MKAAQLVDALDRPLEHTHVGEFVDELAAQPVQLDRRPRCSGRCEQHRQGFTGFVGHHQDGTA